MSAKARSDRRARALSASALEFLICREERQPPSGALLNVILEYADIQQELGADRFMLRLSARRRKDPVIRELLGREAKRLADISILWDEQQGEIIRVLDDAASVASPLEIEGAFCEFDTFELTEAALAYIAQHQPKRRKSAQKS